MSLLPSATGPHTDFNVNGKKIVRKDLEKEVRIIEHDYHIVDWHGTDFYGSCYEHRMCYQVETILPPCEELIIEEKIIRSRKLYKSDKDSIKHVINMFLEIFGICEILNTEFQPISSQVIRQIPWTILPPGKYPWEMVQDRLKHCFATVHKEEKYTIERRHKIITMYEPSFVAVGEYGFSGYIVYGYPDKDLYIFESNEIGNATYIFKGKWEDASKLTKRDIISGALCYRRFIHADNWEKNISECMNEKLS